MTSNPPLIDGLCWRCEKQTKVTWLGPVHTGTASAPMLACERCCQRLHELVWESLQARDLPN
jgi:hypothetical protein